MTYSLTWLPRVLLDAGLKVAEQPGWQTRGLGDMRRIHGVMCHHTADPRTGNMPSLNVLISGRSDLAGPLSQLGLGRDGTFYIIAAGRCNHAGEGSWNGHTLGNSHFIGIEAEHRGLPTDPWPEIQYEAYLQGVAAILKRAELGAEACVGHKEWARDRPPERRKSDPTFNMQAFRGRVAARLGEGVVPLPPVPAVAPPAPGSNAPRPTLRRGMAHPLVRTIQERLGVAPLSDNFGPLTEAAVRSLQRAAGAVPDGIVGPKTWLLIDAIGAQPTQPATAQPVIAPPPIVLSGNQQMAWGAKVTPGFRDRIREIAFDRGCDPSYLMACIAFETGESFSPSIRNQAGSGATGLIQFMPSTAERLGTTTDALAQLTAEAQLDYVGRYFRWFAPVRTLEDVYMAILWPRAIGKPNDYVLFSAPSKVYDQNRGLDTDRDGIVTKFEAAAKVRAKLEKGMRADLLG